MKLIHFCLIALLALIPKQSLATQIAGADITYRCLGSGKYEVTLRVYRDCNGVDSINQILGAVCNSGNDTATFVLQKISVRDVTGIGVNCPDTSRCGGGSYPRGFEEHLFTANIDLSNLNCCEVELYWQQCCRSKSITTGQSGQNFYVTAMVNKCITPCNSSPRFTNPSVKLICVNQDLILNAGALDTIDQCDSLSYELVKGLYGRNKPVSYSGSFSEYRPLTFLGFPNQNQNYVAGFRLDPVSGDLMFRPTKQNEVGTVIIEVQEWRDKNGQMEIIGRTRKDMLIIVIPCPINKIPKIKPPYVFQACAGREVCIDIKTEDDNSGDTVRIAWNEGIPGATFTHNNGNVKWTTGKVCWTPTEADICNTPYSFTITAADNACPIAGQAIRAFQIYVREVPEAQISVDTFACGWVALDYKLTKGSNQLQGFKATWGFRNRLDQTIIRSIKKTDTLQIPPGWYKVVLQLNTSAQCITEVADSIEIPSYVAVKVSNDTLVCNGVEVTANAVGSLGYFPYRYTWNIPSNNPESVKFIPTKDTTLVVVKIEDQSGCTNTDTMQVLMKQPKVNLGVDRWLCNEDVLSLNAGSAKPPLKYLWSNGDTLQTSNFRDPGLIWVQLTDTFGCINKDSIYLTKINTQLNAGSDYYAINDELVQLNATGTDSFVWFLPNAPKEILSNLSNYSFIAKNNVKVVVKGISKGGNTTCTEYDTVQIYVNQKPEIMAISDTAICAGEEVCFIINTNDVDAKDSVKLKLVNAPSDANFTITNPGARFPEARICWKSPNEVRGQMQQFIKLSAADNGNPRVAIEEKTITVNVHPVPIVTGLIVRPACNFFEFDYEVKGIEQSDVGRNNWYITNSQNDSVAQLSKRFDTLSLPRGQYKAELIIESKAGCLDFYGENIESLCDGVGISSINSGDITIYPNPASDEVIVKLPLMTCSLYDFQLKDISGKALIIPIEMLSDGVFALDISGVAAGMYSVNAKCEGQNTSGKLVISR